MATTMFVVIGTVRAKRPVSKSKRVAAKLRHFRFMEKSESTEDESLFLKVEGVLCEGLWGDLLMLTLADEVVPRNLLVFARFSSSS